LILSYCVARRRTYLEPAATDPRVRFRVTDFLKVRHDGAFVGRIDNVVGSGGQSVPPRERCGAASLHSNHGIGLCGWVGTAVADNVVCCYIVDGLGVVLVD
jgi:hypothetical protein